MAYVCVDAPQAEAVTAMPALDVVTTDALAFMRLHGRNEEGFVHRRGIAERFDWEYGEEELREVRGRVERLAEEAREVRVMFNNNRSDYAPRAARDLRVLLGQDAGPAVTRRGAVPRG